MNDKIREWRVNAEIDRSNRSKSVLIIITIATITIIITEAVFSFIFMSIHPFIN